MSRAQPSQSSCARPVFQRHDREAVEQSGPERDHVVGRAVLALQPVRAVVGLQLGHGRVHRQSHLGARLQPGGGDRVREQLQCLGGGGERGSEPAFVADGRGQPALVQDRLQRVVALHAPTERLGERGRADGHQHELLRLQLVVGVHAAVDHVEHRRRQDVRVRSAEVAIERKPARVASPRAPRRATCRAQRSRPAPTCPRCRPDRSMRDPRRADRTHPSRRVPPRSGPGRWRPPVTRPCRRSARRRRRAVRAPHARPSMRRTGPPRGRTRRRRASHRLRPWGCRASRGSREHERVRSGTWGLDGTGRPRQTGDFTDAADGRTNDHT